MHALHLVIKICSRQTNRILGKAQFCGECYGKEAIIMCTFLLLLIVSKSTSSYNESYTFRTPLPQPIVLTVIQSQPRQCSICT